MTHTTYEKTCAPPIRSQKKILSKYAAERGYINIRFYIDDGISGTTFNRPGFQSMIADVEAGLVKRVIFENTHEPIWTEAIADAVRISRQTRRRPTKMGEMGMFLGTMYCADCAPLCTSAVPPTSARNRNTTCAQGIGRAGTFAVIPIPSARWYCRN